MSVQWTNEAPAPKPRMSGTTRFLIGCGVLSLLGVATCGGLVLMGVGKVANFGESEWGQMRKVTAQLQTDEGTKQAWAENPELAKTYASLDEFQAEIRTLRPNLEPLPEKRPDLMSGRLSMNSRSNNGDSHVETAYTNSQGKQQVYAFHNDQLAAISVRAARPRPEPNAPPSGTAP